MTPAEQAFENWAESRGYSLMDKRGPDSKHPRYPSIETEAAWQAWQEAVAHERERAAKVCDIEAEDGNTCAEYFAAAIRRGEP